MGVFSRKHDTSAGGGSPAPPPADDTSRRALFGRKGGGSSQPAAQANPYAQAASNDPYAQQPPANPYQQAKAQAYGSGGGGGDRYGGGGPGSDRYGGGGGGPAPASRPGGLPSGPKGGAGGLPSGPRGGGGLPGGPAPRQQQNPYGGLSADSNPYGGMDKKDRYGGSNSGSGGGAGADAGAGYGANRYGGSSGYGGDRYGTSGGGGGGSRYGGSSGGYGGMGGGGKGGKEADDGAGRDALFGGAKDRITQRGQPGQGQDGGPPPPYSYGGSGISSGPSSNPYAGSGPSGYGGSYGDSGYGGGGGRPYEERELTAEEQEEEEVQASKQQIREMKQSDVSSTRNALRLAQEAEESGRDTLARLGQQGEYIHSTEKNLDLAQNQNRIAEEKARELKTLNKSMFAVHVSNPFTASSRRSARDQAIIDKHVEERDQRESTRMAGYQADQRMQKAFKEVEDAGGARRPGQRNLAERAKYQFEADSEDEQMEDEIDANLDALGGAASRLGQLARATGKEVDEQNRHLDRIGEKSDRVDLGLASNKARLDRIH